MSYYSCKDTPLFSPFLYASKAFDRTNHNLLFAKLMKRNVPMGIVRLLLGWYRQQTTQVKWGTNYSSPYCNQCGKARGSSEPILICCLPGWTLNPAGISQGGMHCGKYGCESVLCGYWNLIIRSAPKNFNGIRIRFWSENFAQNIIRSRSENPKPSSYQTPITITIIFLPHLLNLVII